MRLRPDATTLAACLALAAVAWLAWGTPHPAIALADAAAYEGQAVQAAGQAQDVRSEPGGRTRFELHGEGARLAVRAAQPVAEGAWVEADGLLGRAGGLLTLFADGVRETRFPDAAHVPLRVVAEAPERWLGRPLSIEGTVARGQIGDGAGHRLAVEGGPAGGAQRVSGTLAYRPGCLCYALVAAWNP